MLYLKPINGQDNLGLKGFPFGVSLFTHRVLDGLLRGNADLLQEFTHGHIELFAHDLLLVFIADIGEGPSGLFAC